MAEIAQDKLNIVNGERERNNPHQAILLACWEKRWQCRCLAPNCRSEHDLSYLAAVASQEGEIPHARIALFDDNRDFKVRITKPALAEMIEDLTALLNRMP